MLQPIEIEHSYQRIKPYVNNTPIFTSSFLNKCFNCEIFFKAEGFQKIGAFKFRGAINALLSYKEKNGTLPKKIVAFSSGNHAQAIALAGQMLDVSVRIYTPTFSSKVKIQAAESYGAEVIKTESRAVAERLTTQDINNGFYLLHPFNDEDILLGQGTSCYEALQELKNIDAIFATCGGGGWVAGSYLAKEHLSPSSKMFAAEPKDADDAYNSYKSGKIVELPEPSITIADGARSSKVGDITFEYLKKLDDFYVVDEERIIYWTQWLNHVLKIRVEPTSAVTMGAVEQWLSSSKLNNQRILVLLSGGNMDQETEQKVWQKDYLTKQPFLL